MPLPINPSTGKPPDLLQPASIELAGLLSSPSPEIPYFWLNIAVTLSNWDRGPTTVSVSTQNAHAAQSSSTAGADAGLGGTARIRFVHIGLKPLIPDLFGLLEPVEALK